MLVFSVHVTEGDDGFVLWAKGELDITVTAVLSDALAGVPAGPGRRLVVDASQLAFLDIGGLRVLIAADRRLRQTGGGGLRVRGATGIVLRVFEVMQVTALLAAPDGPKVPRQSAGQTG